MATETLLVGLLLALLWLELTEISPGGLIVPGYLALYFDRPLRVLATVVAALVAVAVYKLLARDLVLFGSRRFVLLVLAGAVVSQAWLVAAPRMLAAPLELRVIGWVIPGVLASNLLRQKWLPTLASAVSVAALTFAIVLLGGLL